MGEFVYVPEPGAVQCECGEWCDEAPCRECLARQLEERTEQRDEHELRYVEAARIIAALARQLAEAKEEIRAAHGMARESAGAGSCGVGRCDCRWCVEADDE